MSKSRLSSIAGWFIYQFRLISVGTKRGNPLFVGIGSTKIFLLAVATLALLPQQHNGEWSWRIWSFLISPPNEIGDTLAGIAGALAFLWIIVTVMLQSKELAAQREELRLTRKEFQRMAEAQDRQVAILAEQGEIFQDEQLDRRQMRTQRILDQRLAWLRNQISSCETTWWFEDLSPPNVVMPAPRAEAFVKDDKSLSVDQAISEQSRSLHSAFEELEASYASGFKNLIRCPSPDELLAVGAITTKIMLLYDELSEDQQERLSSCGVIGIHMNLKTIFELPIWNDFQMARP